jgi:diacylglycerol kinase (ATP)
MRIAIVHNPVAGSAKRFIRMGRLVQQLTLQGHTVLVYGTTRPGDATKLARQAEEDQCEVVVAFGGDGTLNEVIQGLVGTDVAVAAYPGGTTNVWCKEIQMPINPRRAAKVIGQGQRRLIDVGQINDQYFLLMTGIGLDAEVVQNVDLDLKKKVGKLAYVWAIFQSLHYRSRHFRLILRSNPSESVEFDTSASLIIVSNSQRYATLKLVRTAQIDDGKLEVLIFKGVTFTTIFSQIFSVLTNRIEHNPKIGYFRVEEASITTNKPVPTQLDGDLGVYCAETLDIKCVPSALQVVIPYKAPHKLFSR